MKLYYEAIVTDRHGRVIFRESCESRCWLVAYNQLVYGGMAASGQVVKCTDGVNHYQSTTYDLLLVTRPAGYAGSALTYPSAGNIKPRATG